MVLQKRYDNWTLASVWLGSEVEKPMLELERKPTPAQPYPIKTPPPKQNKP
jgi:hypothetical protein